MVQVYVQDVPPERRSPGRNHRLHRPRRRNHRKAARELGLEEGTPVFGGGGDASLIGVGAGATAVGDTHVYSGTSGWIGTVTDKSVVDASNMIAAIVGAEDGKYNYFAEMETSGKCLEWVKITSLSTK